MGKAYDIILATVLIATTFFIGLFVIPVELVWPAFGKPGAILSSVGISFYFSTILAYSIIGRRANAEDAK